MGKSETQQQDSNNPQSTNKPKSWYRLSERSLKALWSFYQAPEKYVAAHMSLFTVYAFFWVSCLCFGLSQTQSGDKYFSSYFLYNGLGEMRDDRDGLNVYRTPFQLGGLSGGQFDVELMYAVLAFLVLTFALWFRLAVLGCDPGSIDSRVKDFDTIMDRSIASHGSPSSSYCCRTTLCIKPMRCKYDRATELLVARMDHYCIWLNHTIGFKNHRLFLAFLVSQFVLSFLFATLMIRSLVRELGQVCGVAEALLGPHYFFVTSLLAVTLAVEVGLIALLFDQMTNIVMNRTVNEKLNYSRYPYMVDEFGNYCNKFDKGWFSNIMEFFQVPGYYIDYMNLFDSPAANVEVADGNLRHSTASTPHREREAARPETPRSVHSVDSETLSVRSQPLFPPSFSASASQKSELEFFGFMSTAPGSLGATGAAMSRSATPVSLPDASLLGPLPTASPPTMSNLLSAPMFPSTLVEQPKRVLSFKRMQQTIAPLRASNNVNYDQIYSMEDKDKVQNNVIDEI